MQTLNTKAFGPLTIERSWAGDGYHIALLPNGTFLRRDGTPITSEHELDLIPVGPWRTKALAWWQHRDDIDPEVLPPAVIFRGGAVVYADTGEPLSSYPEILAAFPEAGPFQDAALQWFASQHAGRKQVQQEAELGISQSLGMVDAGGPPVVERTPQPLPENFKNAKRVSAGARLAAMYGEPTLGEE